MDAVAYRRLIEVAAGFAFVGTDGERLAKTSAPLDRRRVAAMDRHRVRV